MTEMTVVRVPERIYRKMRRHLLPWWHRVEEAAFLYATPTKDSLFEYLEWFPVPASGFVSRSAYHLELNDETRAIVIKRAHDPRRVDRRTALTSWPRAGPVFA